MKSRIVRWGALASLMVLVTLAGAMALFAAARDDGKRDLQQIGDILRQDADAVARRIDLAGQALARDLSTVEIEAVQGALDTAMAKLNAQLSDHETHRLKLHVVGAVHFTSRDGVLQPVASSAGYLGEAGTRPDAEEASAQVLTAIRDAGERLAITLADELEHHASELEPTASTLESHLVASAGSALPELISPHAWLVTRSPDRLSATALIAAVSFEPNAGVMDDRSAVASIAAEIRPRQRDGADEALTEQAKLRAGPEAGRLDVVTRWVPIGDGIVAIALAAPPRTVLEVDLGSLAGPLLILLLIVTALVAFAQADKLRHAQMIRRQRAILKGVAAKQRELEASEERFRHLAESTNVVPWTADLDRQQFSYVGPQIEALSGYKAETWRAAGFWNQHIHPNDRQRALTRAIEEASGGRYATVDYRVRAADGRILHMRNMLTIGKETVGAGADKRVATIAHGFLLDVTELKRAAAALEVARSKAEEANRVKSEFLASMSHELRTPLNAVIGFSEIMKEELFGPLDPQYREYAESVHASGRHLLDLINDVLDLSKIEAGRIELAEEETDVVDLLAESRTLLRERMASAGLHEIFEVDPDLPHLLMDGRRIKQVVLNLLSNAIKFTPPGGEIAVTARLEPGRGVVIAVRDSGIGMSEEEIPKALSKFGQIDGELARKHEGTGLGLPIAKSLVEMHGGRLEILSEKNKGTEMRLVLPESRIVTDAA